MHTCKKLIKVIRFEDSSIERNKNVHRYTRDVPMMFAGKASDNCLRSVAVMIGLMRGGNLAATTY